MIFELSTAVSRGVDELNDPNAIGVFCFYSLNVCNAQTGTSGGLSIHNYKTIKHSANDDEVNRLSPM